MAVRQVPGSRPPAAAPAPPRERATVQEAE
jgi:hypothetical protein